MALDLSKVRQEVGQTGPDFTKPSAGGGDFDPAVIGPTRLRLTGYVETGVHTVTRGGQPKTQPRVELTFELSGPKHEPKKLDDGRLIPFRVKVKEMNSTSERANLVKLFNILNVDGDAKNFVDMLMEKAWRGTISHYTFKTPKGERTIPQLRAKGTGYQIFPVTFEDPETNEIRTVSVPPAISPPKVFLWDYADLDQWDSLDDFSKDTIRKAENFEGSPIYLALAEAGRDGEYALSERGSKDDDEPEGDDKDGEAKPDAASLTDAPAPAPAKTPAKAPASPAKAPKAPAKGVAPSKGADPLQGL